MKTISAFIRVANEENTILACLKSIEGLFDEYIIVHSDITDNTLNLVNEYVKDKSNYIVKQYPHSVYPSHHPIYKTKDYKKENSLAEYYNFAMSLVTGDLVYKIDADQIYITDRLQRFFDYCKSKNNEKIIIGTKGYNTFFRNGKFVKCKNHPINGGADAFLLSRKINFKFFQTNYYEKLDIFENVHEEIYDELLWFHFRKGIYGVNVSFIDGDETSHDIIEELNGEEQELFNKYCKPLLIETNSVYSKFLKNSPVLEKNHYFYMSDYFSYDFLPITLTREPVFFNFHTTLYKPLFDNYFLPSLKNLDCDLKSIFFNFKNYNEFEIQIQKIIYVLNCITSLKNNQFFIYSDSDIVFTPKFNLENIKKLVNDFNLVTQFSYNIENYISSGFYAGKKCSKVINFLRKVIGDMISFYEMKKTINDINFSIENYKNDQYYFNKNKNMLSFFILDQSHYSPGIHNKILEVEDFDNAINQIPHQAEIIHANWIKSVENKALFLQKCKDKNIY